MRLPSNSLGDARRLLRQSPLLALALAGTALLLLAAAPLGWRAGWWHYRVGLQVLLPYAGYLGLVAAAAALLGLGLMAVRIVPRRFALLAVLALLGSAAAVYFPSHWSHQRGLYPRVNDITTDLDKPPPLAFAEAARRAEGGHPPAYRGAALAAAQRSAYPDIAPVMLNLAPGEAFDRALSIGHRLGWTILKADREPGVIEAVERSRWFGFTDDIAIRVTAAEDGSRVDIRSAARQGNGDYGVNAARVRRFLAALRAGGGAE